MSEETPLEDLAKSLLYIANVFQRQFMQSQVRVYNCSLSCPSLHTQLQTIPLSKTEPPFSVKYQTKKKAHRSNSRGVDQPRGKEFRHSETSSHQVLEIDPVHKKITLDHPGEIGTSVVVAGRLVTKFYPLRFMGTKRALKANAYSR